MATHKYAVRELVCVGCDRKVKQRMPRWRKYCSPECYRGNRPTRLRGGYVKCATCKATIWRTPSSVKKRNFCSKSCYDHYQSRNKTEHTCKTCGSLFYWSRSRTCTGHNITYCSITCRNKCADWRASTAKGNLSIASRSGPTSLEYTGAALLRAMKIKYRSQVLIDGYVVDIRLLDYQILIQWDGDYWHGWAKRGAICNLTERQQRQRRQDARVTRNLRKSGYIVLRFWEHDVLHNQEKVRGNIRAAIQAAT